MAQFYWNSINPKGDPRKAYEKYLQNTAYVKDINDCIAYNSNGIKAQLQENNATTRNIERGISNICGSLDSGFEFVGNQLKGINSGIQDLCSEISSLSSLLDWRLSALIEGQRITNNLLGNISDLLKIPDVQKERVYYIEEGLKYLKNGLAEEWDSDFFDESYVAFNEALIREPKDYISLSRIGFIHLYSKQHLDFEQAEKYLRKAIRYANAEIVAGGTNFSNTLNPLNNDFSIMGNIHLVSSVESMLYCARACALQNKFSEAIQLATNAYSIIPTFLTAAYESAKYNCLANEVETALPIILEIIEKDRLQTIKIIGDPDLMCKNDVVLLLEKISKNKQTKLREGLDYCLKQNINNLQYNQLVQEVNLLAKENSFLHSCKGLDLINLKRSWNVKDFSYCKKFLEFSKNGMDYYTIEDYLNFVISNYYGYLPNNPDEIPVTYKVISFENITIFDYISVSESYFKNNSVLVQRCINHLEKELLAKKIFGGPKLNETKRENALWLIDYLKNI